MDTSTDIPYWVLALVLVVGLKGISFLCHHFAPGISFYQRCRLLHYHGRKSPIAQRIKEGYHRRLIFWITLCFCGTVVGILVAIWCWIDYNAWARNGIHPSVLYDQMKKAKRQARKLNREERQRSNRYGSDEGVVEGEIVEERPALTQSVV